MQIYLPQDDTQRELGTSIYKVSPMGVFAWKTYGLVKDKTVPFLPNSGYAFVVIHPAYSLLRSSWHGREAITVPIEKPRACRSSTRTTGTPRRSRAAACDGMAGRVGRPFHPIAKSQSERQRQRFAGSLNAAASKWARCPVSRRQASGNQPPPGPARSMTNCWTGPGSSAAAIAGPRRPIAPF